MPTPAPTQGSSERRIARYYNEPLGPPSSLVSLNFSHQQEQTIFSHLEPGSHGGWVEQAQNALERLEHELDRITAGENLRVDQGEPDLGRCDVSDLSGEVSKWHDNLYYREEIKKFTEPRVYRTSLASTLPSRKKKDRFASTGPDEGEEEEAGEEEEGGGTAAKKRKVANAKKGKAAKGKGKAGDTVEGQADEEDEDGVVMDKEVKQLVTEVEQKSLAILKPWDSEFYLRKTKVTDLNCLPEIRPTFETAPAPAPSDNPDPLSNILLTITFLPISRKTGRIRTSPQQQTLVCLAANTLGELRDNLTAGGDAIPKPLDQPRNAHDQNGDDDDSDTESRAAGGLGNDGQYGIGELDEMGTIAAATRKNVSGHFGISEDDEAKLDHNGEEFVEWSEERRVTGACFGIEGVFYPDLNGDEKIDYAQMLLEAIDKTKWSDKNGKRFTARSRRLRRRASVSDSEDEDEDDDGNGSSSSVPASPVNPRSNDISVDSTPAPHEYDNIDPVLRDGYVEGQDLTIINGEPEKATMKQEDPNKPRFVAGTAMHQTKLGDISLRVGQPYWFVHQGNYEQVWIIDSIRYRHPSDPPLTAPTSNHPYPLTTYLSRNLAHKCHICDRDPATLFLLNDFTASESPSYVCRICFDLLHPEIPTQRDLEKAARKEQRLEEKRMAKEEKKKAILKERRKLKRKNKPKDDDSVGSGGENEEIELELPVMEESEEETEEEEEGEDDQVRDRKRMEGIRVVPTVIER
ncbi:hypothetical protein JCM3765_002301 [Sporobolomyces pararoseus]